jgi:hypothetical protein
MIEIDATHYCANTQVFTVDDCDYLRERNCTGCTDNRCKWETLAEYKARTGKDWPDDAAVYFRYWRTTGWAVLSLCGVNRLGYKHLPIVCANSDWGVPPDDWRPES